MSQEHESAGCAAKPRPVILQSGEQVPAGANYIPSDPGNVLWGRLPSRDDLERHAVGEVAPGGDVVIDTVSHEGLLPDQGSDPVAYFGGHGVPEDQVLSDAVRIAASVPRDPAADGPHVVVGPIRVPGAHPGDLLAVTPTALTCRVPYGVISTRHARGVLAGSDDFDGNYGQFCHADEAAGTAWFHARLASGEPANGNDPNGPDPVIRFDMHPFLGITGVTPDSGERPSSIPPAAYGGNVDLRNLTVGSTLLLPVQVEGAGLYIGDPHFAQGNGEVSLTALEASLRATLHVEVVPAQRAKSLFGRTDLPFAFADGRLIPLGFGDTLDDALSQSVEHAIDMVSTMFSIDRKQTYLLLSAAVDFDVTQAVDIVKGAHGLIDLSMFRDCPAYDDVVRAIEALKGPAGREGDAR
ncbi:acetamidase/formamidase family protein [Bifidobacterium amazonense]|uniref:Acetamidase/formamidase family protein n=1 Tax=Bifidobacterium amazonense TaxID=2809027 RepID=A0ABS9VWS3_9BIFI|nr:acetamidase/formamidase family protein [Bifidobacterium amazonense]MCH9276567.1 acetamidase/formamidase family protein [Bifidobacterium amazonense]